MSKIVSKRVSNYELFYDLVFVLATSGLTGLLHGEHITRTTIIIFISASVGVLSLWFYETVYLNKFGERDPEDIYTIIASMFVLGQMSVNMTATPTQDTLTLFQILYAISYSIILIQYILRGRKSGAFTPDMRLHMKNLYWIIGFYLLTSLGAATRLLPIGDWVMFVTFFPLALPFFLRNIEMTHRINFPHLLERCQLITIITFGETVIAIIRSYPFASYPLESILLFVGMAFLFISYISQTHLNIAHHQIAPTQPLIYSHLGIITGLNLFTVGIEMLANSHHASAGHLFFLIGISVFYLCLLSTSSYNREELRWGHREWFAQLMVLAINLLLLFLVGKNLLALGATFLAATWSMHRIGFLIRRNAKKKT